MAKQGNETGNEATRLTPEAEARAKALLEKIDTDWPSIEKTLSGWAVMEHIHGRPYTGPSIDFNGAWQLLRDLLAELARVRQERDEETRRLRDTREELYALELKLAREAKIRQRLRDWLGFHASTRVAAGTQYSAVIELEQSIARMELATRTLAELTRLEQEGS